MPPVVPESDETTAFTRLRVAWQVPVVRSARTVFDAGLSGEGEWGDNASVLKLPPFLGGDVNGDYALSRASGGAYTGARHEHGSLLYEASLRLDLATGDVLQANPHVGVVWRPGTGSTRLRASLGRASKLPSFFALGSPPALGGNPALSPEHAWGGEAGVEHRVAPAHLDVGAAYFRQEYTNLVDFDFDTFLHVNRASVRTQGVEMTARWQPHPRGLARRRGDLARRPGSRDRRDTAAHAEVDGRRAADLAAEPGPQPACPGEGHGGIPRRAVSGARPELGRRLRAAGRRGVLALQPQPVGPRPRRQPHRRVVRDLHRLPGPGRAFWVGLGWDR